LELTNADVPISINVATGASLPALVGDPNLNINDGAFDLELATFNVSEVTISDIVNTFPTISKANNQLRRATAYSVNDMVLCQSASDSLIFICTTAGTTAVQEPTGYATITDGNTVTDGTAAFNAYSVSDSIYKSRQVSDSGDAYDPTRPYKVGELCIYDNVLYRCITACSAGSWATNQSCFTADTLVNVANNDKWKYVGSALGSNPIAFPQGAKELCIRVDHPAFTDYSIVNIITLPTLIITNAMFFDLGTPNMSALAWTRIYITPTYIVINTSSVNNINDISSVQLNLFYR
jgi:hypothetical protein